MNERIKQLDRTGTPLPFEVYYAATVENAEKEERNRDHCPMMASCMVLPQEVDGV